MISKNQEDTLTNTKLTVVGKLKLSGSTILVGYSDDGAYFIQTEDDIEAVYMSANGLKTLAHLLLTMVEDE